MDKIIEQYAGKGTPLCEAIKQIYAICEGVTDMTTVYQKLNQRYGKDGKPDPAKIAEMVDLVANNDRKLYDMMFESKASANSVAWIAMMQELNAYLEFMEEKPLNVEGFKQWFAASGMTPEEVMGQSVQVIENNRAARARGES